MRGEQRCDLGAQIAAIVFANEALGRRRHASVDPDRNEERQRAERQQRVPPGIGAARMEHRIVRHNDDGEGEPSADHEERNTPNPSRLVSDSNPEFGAEGRIDTVEVELSTGTAEPPWIGHHVSYQGPQDSGESSGGRLADDQVGVYVRYSALIFT
jgi:hypothetical protein